jgi:hypothetical protein
VGLAKQAEILVYRAGKISLLLRIVVGAVEDVGEGRCRGVGFKAKTDFLDRRTGDKGSLRVFFKNGGSDKSCSRDVEQFMNTRCSVRPIW